MKELKTFIDIGPSIVVHQFSFVRFPTLRKIFFIKIRKSLKFFPTFHFLRFRTLKIFRFDCSKNILSVIFKSNYLHVIIKEEIDILVFFVFVFFETFAGVSAFRENLCHFRTPVKAELNDQDFGQLSPSMFFEFEFVRFLDIKT